MAGKALKSNLVMMGPHVLPFREQMKVLWSMILKGVCTELGKVATKRGWKIEIPKVC